jgi:hypothetical protein
MRECLWPGLVLCGPTSEARFIVMEVGTATTMPSLAHDVVVQGSRMACGTDASATGDTGLQGGRRYRDHVTGLTLMCIWPGEGPLAYEGRELLPEPALSELVGGLRSGA